MRFTFEMKFGMDISEKFMDDNEVDFNDGVASGDIKIGELEFRVIDPDGEELKVDGLDNEQLLGRFMQTLKEKAGAE